MVEIFMRPAEFAESEILEAGKKVEAAGKRVTGYAIRRELGGGDQKRLFSVWNSHFEQGAVEPAQLYELPVEMEDVLNRLTGELGAQVRAMAVRLNTHAVKAAERQVAEITREYRELKELNEAEQKDASLIITELEEQLQATTAEFNAMREYADREHSKAIRLEAQLSETTNEAVEKPDSESFPPPDV